jgi:hypothetical protein
VTADIAQADEAATKLLEGELDKSMQKFQAKTRISSANTPTRA